MVKLIDIANELGVTVSTVSKALNHKRDISEELANRIIETALHMGYTPRAKKNRDDDGNEIYAKSLCVLIDNMDYQNRDEFGYDLIEGFRIAATHRGWSIDVIPTRLNAQTQKEYDKFMLSQKYNGAFIIGFSIHDNLITQFLNTTVPTVLFDNFIPDNPKVGYVGTDCNEALELAVRHLYDLGHTKIAFLNGAKNAKVSVEQTQAFIKAMKDLDLYIDPHLLESGYYVPDCAKYHVPKFLDHGATAIICASDIIASGAISEVQKRGLRVPEDISIIGYDDLPLCLSISPQITTICQDRLSLGKSALTLLNCLIENIPISQLILRPKLIVRDSTAVCNHPVKK